MLHIKQQTLRVPVFLIILRFKTQLMFRFMARVRLKNPNFILSNSFEISANQINFFCAISVPLEEKSIKFVFCEQN